MYVIIGLYWVNMASSGSVGSSYNMFLGVFSGAIWYYRSITGGQYRPLFEYGPKQAISQYGHLVSQQGSLFSYRSISLLSRSVSASIGSIWPPEY